MSVIKLFEGEVNLLGDETLIQVGPVRVISRKLNNLQFDGSMSPDKNWTVVERSGGSAVIVYNTDTRKILLVEQVRPPVMSPTHLGESVGTPDNPRILEIPAGGFGNDNPRECARRELVEEAGIDAQHLSKVSEFYLSPGISNEIIHLYYAPIDSSNIVGVGGGLLEENEDVMVHWVTLEEAEIMIYNGELNDAKTVVGVLWLVAFKRKNRNYRRKYE